MTEFDVSVVFRIVDVAGVLTNALLGGAVARGRRFDIVGFVILSLACGLGGGMIRDVLLQSGFPVALTDPLYLSSALVGAAIAYLLSLESRWTRRMLTVADLLALGCWSATGTAKALGVGLDILPALMLGVITGVGGGMLRDILIGRVPRVFGGNPLYATVALVGSLEMVVLHRLGQAEIGMTASIITCTVLGVLSIRRGWQLPTAPELQWHRLSDRLRPPRIPRPALVWRDRRRRSDEDGSLSSGSGGRSAGQGSAGSLSSGSGGRVAGQRSAPGQGDDTAAGSRPS